MNTVFTSRSVAALRENDLANHRPRMLPLITTLGGTIAAVCSRCRSRRNYEFAMHRRHLHYSHCGVHPPVSCFGSRNVIFGLPWKRNISPVTQTDLPRSEFSDDPNFARSFPKMIAVKT